jgi:hypothetical protein
MNLGQGRYSATHQVSEFSLLRSVRALNVLNGGVNSGGLAAGRLSPGSPGNSKHYGNKLA